MMRVGDLSRAAVWLRRTASIGPRGAETQKDRLTYLMNLGEVRQFCNQLDEARDVLEEGLREREGFYSAKLARKSGHAQRISCLQQLVTQLDASVIRPRRLPPHKP